LETDSALLEFSKESTNIVIKAMESSAPYTECLARHHLGTEHRIGWWKENSSLAISTEEE
jgi:hypothetical protein